MVYALVQRISNKQSAEVEDSPVQNPLENSKMRFETPVPGHSFSCLYFQYNPDLRFSAPQRRRQSLFASGFLTIGAMLFVVPSADAQTEVATAAASKAGLVIWFSWLAVAHRRARIGWALPVSRLLRHRRAGPILVETSVE